MSKVQAMADVAARHTVLVIEIFISSIQHTEYTRGVAPTVLYET